MTAALLAGLLLFAPGDEDLLREEGFNYRIAGALPESWKRQGESLEFVYDLEGVRHAHVVLVRAYVPGELDLRARLSDRATSYRFPDAPADARIEIGDVVWGGLPALRLRLSTSLHGVPCERTATVLHDRGRWYELIETAWGDRQDDEAFQQGRRVFREGFQILALPLPPDAAERDALHDARFGWSLRRPAGFSWIESDPLVDPGCRVSMERHAPGGARLLVRLFEYGVRDEGYAGWMDRFFSAFSSAQEGAARLPETAPSIPGARAVEAERFVGARDGKGVSELVLLAQSRSGTVFALRVRTIGDERGLLAESAAEAVEALALDG